MIEPLVLVRGTRFAAWPIVWSSRQNIDAACAAINTLIAG